MNLHEIKEKLNIREMVENSERRLRKNTVLSFFYEKLAEDIYFDDVAYMSVKSADFWARRYDTIKKRGEAVLHCTKFCMGDYYRMQGVKDLQRVNLCRDRFCENCQNALSQQRYEKYLPMFEQLTDYCEMYHIVFTVPNVKNADLKRTIDKMYDSFNRLIRYFDGRKRVRGLDFWKYGYVGAVRSLEITKNKERNDFHPHLHCIFAFRVVNQGLDKNRTHINPYSFNNPDVKRSHKKDEKRFFSDFEILLQKVWRLLIDGVEVNYSNVQELPLGYSVICDNAKGRYKEIFKYATKGLLSVGKDNAPDSVYEDFCTLFFVLFRRKLTQGYGCFYHLKFDDDFDMSADDEYFKVVQALHDIENPDEYHEDFKEMYKAITGDKNITYISRKSINRIGAKDFTDEWELPKK